MQNTYDGLTVDRVIASAGKILGNNYFEFEEKVFRQKLGTVGTTFAPGFVNMFMGCFEEKFISSGKFRPWVW